MPSAACKTVFMRVANERGVSLTVFACGAVLVLLIMTGLVVDGAAQLLARQRAENGAAQVARFAMDAAAPYMVDGQDPTAAALAAATKAATSYPGISFEFRVDQNGALHVSTATAIETQFLCLIGITTLPASGHAVAIVFQP